MEVFGSAGMASVANNTPNRTRLCTAESVQEDLPLYFFIERYLDSYIAEMKAFISCIIEDKAPEVSGMDGRAPVVMGKAARLSYDQKRPVKLSEIS
ncbi:Myo-inositol 2-dehydrogenase [subsurface metagenome]